MTNHHPILQNRTNPGEVKDTKLKNGREVSCVVFNDHFESQEFEGSTNHVVYIEFEGKSRREIDI